MHLFIVLLALLLLIVVVNNCISSDFSAILIFLTSSVCVLRRLFNLSVQFYAIKNYVKIFVVVFLCCLYFFFYSGTIANLYVMYLLSLLVYNSLNAFVFKVIISFRLFIWAAIVCCCSIVNMFFFCWFVFPFSLYLVLSYNWKNLYYPELFVFL